MDAKDTEVNSEKRTSIKKCLDGPKPVRTDIYPPENLDDDN